MFEEIKKAIESMQKQCEKDIDYTNDKDMTAICLLGEQAEKVIKALSEYMELKKAKAEGRLVVLPCKPGDTIYMPFCGRAIDYIIDRWEIRQDDTYAISRGGGRLCKADAICKTVFLSRAEAEKAAGGGKDV